MIASHQFAEPIVTQIKPATTFWPAENYHQQFYKKQQKRYKKIKKSHQQFLFLSGQRKNGLEETNKYTYSLAVT